MLIEIISKAKAGDMNKILREYLEDILAMNSPDYIKSIEKAKKEMRKENT